MDEWQRSLLEKAELPTDPACLSACAHRRIGITFPNNLTITATCAYVSIGMEPTLMAPDAYARDRQKLVITLANVESVGGTPALQMPWLIMDAEGRWTLRAYHAAGGLKEEEIRSVRFF